MRLITVILFLLLLPVLSTAGNVSLDPHQPVYFNDTTISFMGEIIPLNERSFFVNGNMNDKEIAGSPYVFNNLRAALENISDGSGSQSMTLHIAPYVYWIDDPDDPVQRQSSGGIPYGMEIKCDRLRFHGLTMNPENIIFAVNRGQTAGAIGNYTMFHITGNDITAENVTFGNYCNVDLEYPLKPELCHVKRNDAIVQAQLIIYDGDRISARNCCFISRLNLCPFVGGGG